jgi:hypothetical protein
VVGCDIVELKNCTTEKSDDLLYGYGYEALVLILGCSGTMFRDAPLALKLAHNMVRSGHVATEVPPSRRRKANGSNRGKKKKGGLLVCLCNHAS